MTTEPLFVGQSTHPLSIQETEAFFERLDISGEWGWFSFEDKRNIREALEEIIKTPTGAAQAREIIKNRYDTFEITADNNLDSNGSIEDGTLDISINIGNFQQPDGKIDFQQLGTTILHECLHGRQYNDEGSENRSLMDAETHAQDQQLRYETGKNCDPIYKKSFEKNLKKMAKIRKKSTFNAQGFAPI